MATSTLGDLKRKTLKLLDEYSSGGEITIDQDIDIKMNDFFDMAQKEMATYKRIIKSVDLELDGSELITLPDDFVSYFRVWKDGRITKLYPIRENKLYAHGEKGNITVEYFAMPQTIDADTPDTYVFEVSEDAANCLPFYVASQQLITDLVVDYGALWNMYLSHRNALDLTLPSAGSSGIFVQSVWR